MTHTDSTSSIPYERSSSALSLVSTTTASYAPRCRASATAESTGLAVLGCNPVHNGPAELSDDLLPSSFCTSPPPMPLTPDDALELLFNPALLPQAVRDVLPPELHIRPLSSTDHARGHLAVLSVLTPTPDPGLQAYQERFRAQRALPDTYFTLVIVDRASDRVVATGTLFLERKFTRGLGLVGHIEDIAVDKGQQGKKLGLRVIQALTALSEGRGAYKTILNCSKDNIPFYEKCGFALKECEMAKYAKDTQVVQKL